MSEIKPLGSAGRCSFCEQEQPRLGLLITGKSALICHTCVKLCAEIVISGKDDVYDKADLKRARAEGRKAAFAEIGALMEALWTERSRRSFFGAVIARLRQAGGPADG